MGTQQIRLSKLGLGLPAVVSAGRGSSPRWGRPGARLTRLSVSFASRARPAGFGRVAAGLGAALALLFAAGAAEAQTTDTTAPTVSSAAVNGQTLLVTFDENLDVASVPEGSAYTVTATPSGGSARALGILSAQPSVVEPTLVVFLTAQAAHGETVTLAYTKPSINPLQDTAGNEVATFSEQAVTNNTPAPPADPPPAFSSATVNGTVLTVTFNEALDTNSAPAGSAFSVTRMASHATVQTIAGTGTAILSGMTATVTLASAVAQGGIVMLSYTVPASDPLRDEAGNEVATFRGRVTNNAPDTIAPTVIEARVFRRALSLYFNETLDEFSVPAGSAFSVTATPPGGAARTIRGEGTVRLGVTVAVVPLAETVAQGELVTASYTAPASNPLRDEAGNEVATFSDRAVTNYSRFTPPPPPQSNQAVVSDAGEDVGAGPGATVTLDGSGSSAPDGDALSYAWSQSAGEAVELQGADTATPSFTAPAMPGVLTFQLTVSDPGGLSASDTVTVKVGRLGAVHRVPLLPPASHPYRQGFVRVINRSAEQGEVSIVAFDDAGMEHGPLTLRIGASAAVQFNSADLEAGNPDKGLSGGVGEGESDWRLELESALELEVLAYVRTPGGALSSVHDVVPEDEAGHRVVFFNPASNRGRVSGLRLINPGEAAAAVRISGIDDAGEAGESAVEFTLEGRASRSLSAQALESGEGEGLTGALGDGTGKWRLRVTADQPIRVMSLLASGPHLANVSTAPDP